MKSNYTIDFINVSLSFESQWTEQISLQDMVVLTIKTGHFSSSIAIKIRFNRRFNLKTKDLSIIIKTKIMRA